MTALQSKASGPLKGTIQVPGDKSISHRALMLGAVAVGETRITGLLEGEDVLATAQAMRQLGAVVERDDSGEWTVSGRGVGGLQEPSGVLDMGNSGTAARLLMGLLASCDLKATFTGDDSLSGRPMGRVITPLSKIGAKFESRDGGKLPITIIGTTTPLPITYELPVASAQVKSAVLLAGLNTAGQTKVIEPRPSRDHSELMLRHFGAEVDVIAHDDGAREITLTGQPELTGADVIVPGDISSAAFPISAALIAGESDVHINNVGMNPLRSGLVQTLLEMGADIHLHNERIEAGEPVADLVVRASSLKGIEVPAHRAPAMIDEYPILAVVAAMAEGTTTMYGLGELRVKESDRLAVMAEGLAACGVTLEEGEDYLIVHGTGGVKIPGGATVKTHLDHRIAMSFLVLGMVADAPVTIDDAAPIETSFPGFVDLLNGLGAAIGA